MGVSFFIKDRKKETSSIHCSVNYKGIKRFVFIVPNIQVPVKDWENGWIKTGRGRQNNSHIENSLNDLKSKIDNFYQEFIRVNQRLPVADDFIRYINSNVKLENYFTTTKVFEVCPIIQEIITRRKEGIELNKGKVFGVRTTDQYQSTLNQFIEYGEKNGKKITNLDVINKDFILGFQGYLTKTEDQKLNSVGNRMKFLKAFLEVLVKDDIIPYNPFKKYKIPISREESISIALEESELKEMEDLDLSDNPRLENVRDQFLILCWTGLRISDLKSFIQIPKDNEIITITNKKTRDQAHIPIFPAARKILDKYKETPPKHLSEEKMRKYLKEIGVKIEGLKRSLEVSYTQGGKRVKTIKKRYELLSLHVGRRTLATHLVRIGIPYHEIMLITGHKTLRSFENYIKINRKDVLNSVVSRVKEHERLEKLKNEQKEQL